MKLGLECYCQCRLVHDACAVYCVEQRQQSLRGDACCLVRQAGMQHKQGTNLLGGKLCCVDIWLRPCAAVRAACTQQYCAVLVLYRQRQMSDSTCDQSKRRIILRACWGVGGGGFA